MAKGQQKRLRESLAAYQLELANAKESGEKKEESIASVNIGLTYFQQKKPKEGIPYFEEALRIAKDIQDEELQIRVMGAEALAYQIAEQYPNAFKIAQKIQAMGEANGDQGVQIDALATQGQILIDAGDELAALEKFTSAKAMAKEIGDIRRLMNIAGALGNYSLTIAGVEQAKEHFAEAKAMAAEMGDKKSEIGFLGNYAAILAWEKNHSEAASAYKKVYEYLSEGEDEDAQLQALHHLVQNLSKMQDFLETVRYSRIGLDLAQKLEEKAFIFLFIEEQIAAHIQLDQLEDANIATREAVEIARDLKDRDKELELLISLGESSFLAGSNEEALEAYEEAKQEALRLQRHKDHIHLTGRIGVVLAELGRIDEAIPFHREAVELAREKGLREIEGEQLTMLALALTENGQSEEAVDFCNQAIEVFTAAKLMEEADKTRGLLSTIKA